MIIEPKYDPAGGAKKIPAGIYNFRVLSSEAGTTQKGDPQVIWNLIIIDHADAEINGRKRNLYQQTTGPGAHFLKELYQVFDPSYESGQIETEHVVGGKFCAFMYYTMAKTGDREFTNYKDFAPYVGRGSLSDESMAAFDE